MEKMIWVVSVGKSTAAKTDDGLTEVNEYLKKGWTVKHISACAMGDVPSCGQAYVVIEKID